jgi:nicotinamide-nucleotide amidase
MFSPPLLRLAEMVLMQAREQKLRIATAESCTGGLIAGLLTEIAGSSDVFDRGFVTYSNGAKADLLGVEPLLIADKGAVSEEVARAMAIGALTRSKAGLTVSVTGIAGPGGGSAEKPVGLVYFATARRAQGAPVRQADVAARAERFGDLGRDEIRSRSVEVALEMLRDALRELAA